MDFTIGKNSPGRSFPIENRRAGFPLRPSGPADSFPLQRSGEGYPLSPNEDRMHPLQGRGFPLEGAKAGKSTEAEQMKLRKAAEGFEAIFIRQFLKTMRSTVDGGTMYGSGATGEMYADMAETALAEAMAKEGRFGIADALYRRYFERLNPNISEGGNIPAEKIPQAGGPK